MAFALRSAGYSVVATSAEICSLPVRSGIGSSILPRTVVKVRATRFVFRTNAGDELYGRVEDEGETAISRDIILESPPKGLRRIRYDENGEVAEEYHLTGYAYVHNQSISHIEFDRLENADEAEAREAEMDDQRTLSDNYAKVSGEEIAELKEFADDDTDGKQTESD
ncbi:hypothetical protein [Halorussus caseinilyticus]|uniref:Uncharacterized protein n=1 Tax=Halorussus caseinilyticus TaxID=3034025 RepID=A0ABD5WR78_9EURY